MVCKHRYGWGYRTLVAEVSDSLHLRRFCRIGLGERVPDESTVRKLTRRLGPEVVAELSRLVIAKARREKRFRPRAARVDSTVIEADVKYPTDAGLAAHGVRALAAHGRKLAAKIGETKVKVRDRSRAMGRRLRAISRTLRRRCGEAKAEVLALTEQTGELLARSVKEARRLATRARATARGRGARAKLLAAARLEELAERCERVAAQIKRRAAGERITDRLISLSDPDARPIRKGKLGKPNEFGYVCQLAEVTPNTKRGARGFVLAPATAPGNPSEDTLLPQTVAELVRLGLSPREVALDGGFNTGPTADALAPLDPEKVFISGRRQPGSRRTQRRMQRYRTGAEGRISHLKRGYGLRRSRLKGAEGQRIWTGWGILAYNLDTYTRLT
jgi:transposase, IS5 family